jgi:hypothetical protein
MTDDELTTYTRAEVLRVLRISDSTLLRWKGCLVHPWPDPDDPSGRRHLYDRTAIDNLARRLGRRGVRGVVLRSDPPSRVQSVRPPATPRLETSIESAPSVRRTGGDAMDDAWARELDARRARGEPDFADEVVPSSRRKR